MNRRRRVAHSAFSCRGVGRGNKPWSDPLPLKKGEPPRMARRPPRPQISEKVKMVSGMGAMRGSGDIIICWQS